MEYSDHPITLHLRHHPQRSDVAHGRYDVNLVTDKKVQIPGKFLAYDQAGTWRLGVRVETHASRFREESRKRAGNHRLVKICDFGVGLGVNPSQHDSGDILPGGKHHLVVYERGRSENTLILFKFFL